MIVEPTHTKTTHLLYLHGFRSSPRSQKSRAIAAYLARYHPQVQWYCPQLPPSPRLAMQQVTQACADWPASSMGVIGSSLGGFYANWIARQKGCHSVVLNPAVYPARDLTHFIGEHTVFHDPAHTIYFQPEFIQELRDLECPVPDQSHPILAIIAKGDEVLDWHEMNTYFQQCQRLLLDGGDHALSNFPELLPRVMAHLGLN